jgi:phosphatidylserine decarboxylase
MNWHAVAAIFMYEMKRFFRTMGQSLVSPVISTVLYFVVFGAAIGSRIQEIDGVSYGAFIVPGLIMLSLLTQSVSNASFGIYFPRFSGTIFEFLAAPISATEMVLGRRCRRRQVSAHRDRHSGDFRLLRAPVDCPPGLDGRLHAADRFHVQPSGFHHRPVGRRF